MSENVKHMGSASLSYDTRGGLFLTLDEDIGQVASPVIIGVETSMSYFYSPKRDAHLISILPLDGYIDIAFTSGERSIYDNKYGLILRGGALDTVSEYGEMFPLLGGGLDVYFETERDVPSDPIFFGKAWGRFGRLGMLDIGSEKIDFYKTTYDGVNIYAGGLLLGIKPDKIIELSGEGVFGYISVKENYLGDWENGLLGPDVYNMFYGGSVKIKVASYPLRLIAAYYLLLLTGKDRFGDFPTFDIYTEDSTENTVHRVYGNAWVTAVNSGLLTLDIGIMGTFLKSSRKDKYSLDWWDDKSETDKTWNDKMFRANPYLRLNYDMFSAEVGGGYSKGFNFFDTTCEYFCYPTDYDVSGSNWNVFLRGSIYWGGPK